MSRASAAVRTHVAGLGPFFVFEVHAEGGPPPGPWHPVAELVADGGLALAERVATVRARLAAGAGRGAVPVEERVAASVTHLGLTARLLSPLLALTALHAAPPRLTLADLRWRPAPGGLFPLSLPDRVLDPASPRDPAAAFLAGPLRQLVDATAEFAVSPQVLWGNVASAINGAARAAASAATPLGHRVGTAADALLDHPLLHGTHDRRTVDSPFRRRSCCLIYRAAPGGRATAGRLCGDCVLTPR